MVECVTNIFKYKIMHYQLLNTYYHPLASISLHHPNLFNITFDNVRITTNFNKFIYIFKYVLMKYELPLFKISSQDSLVDWPATTPMLNIMHLFDNAYHSSITMDDVEFAFNDLG